MVKIKKHMLLEFEHLGVGLIVKVRRYAETRLGPENLRQNLGVLFNSYEVDVLIEERIRALRIEVAFEPSLEVQRIDWATTQKSGSVKVLESIP